MKLHFQDYIPHYRALLTLGTPLIIGQIGIVLQNFADTLMIGQHSTVELAAASLVSNLFILGMLMAMGFALSLTPIIGKLCGQGRNEEIGGVLRNGLVVNTLVAVALMAVYTLLYFLLDHMGQPAELLPYARPYYLINLVSLPFVCWLNAMKQLFDGTADTKAPMWILLWGNALNIFGNWLLIYGHWGLPEWGIVGAGVSTLLARVVMFVAILLTFAFSRRHATERRTFVGSRTSRQELIRLFGLGLPISLQMGMESGAWSLCSVIVGWIGTPALAGHQVMLTISQMFFQFYYAMSAAVSIRVSHFHGQRDYLSVRRTAWAGCHLNFLMACLVSLGHTATDYLSVQRRLPVHFQQCHAWTGLHAADDARGLPLLFCNIAALGLRLRHRVPRWAYGRMVLVPFWPHHCRCSLFRLLPKASA